MTGSQYIIRDACGKDEQAVVELWRASGLLADYNNPQDDFHFALKGPASTVLVAENGDGRLIGSVMVGHDGHRGWLYYVATALQFRGQGVGGGLIAAAENWLRRMGIRKAQLMIRHSNISASSFYEALGYEDMPRKLMSKWI